MAVSFFMYRYINPAKKPVQKAIIRLAIAITVKNITQFLMVRKSSSFL